jgi:two-component sensor histidine kinase
VKAVGLKTYLTFIVAAAVLPLMLFAAAMVYRVSSDGREIAQDGLRDAAVTLALAIDSKIQARIATLATLAASSALARGDLVQFEADLRAVAEQLGAPIIYTDADGQMLINTRLPSGAPLPRHSAPEFIKHIVTTGNAEISDLFFGRVVQRFNVTINVPVRRGGQVIGVLDTPLVAEQLSDLLEVAKLRADARSTLIDSQGVIVARNHDSEKYVGQPAPAWFLSGSARAPHDVVFGEGVEGESRAIAFRRLTTAPWILAVAVPRAALNATSDRALKFFSAGALVLAAFALGGAAFLGHHLLSPVRSLVRAAPDLLRGELPPSAEAPIAEIAALDSALREAAKAVRRSHDEHERAAIAEARAQALAESAERLRESEARAKLLATEVDHRAKNLLTLVQAMVRMTRADTLPDYMKALQGRIAAISHAHTLLSQSRWEGANIKQLIEEELAAYKKAGASRVTIHGPAMALKPAAAQSMAMVIHELATNAVKHGAWSTTAGRVDVTWSVDGAKQLALRWLESGGPPVSVPQRKGLGGGVIERSIRDQLNGTVTQDWRPEGLCCEITIPSNQLHGP